MRLRLVISTVALLVTFLGGAITSRLVEGQAQARPVVSQPASVFVPPDGLAFRTMDGRIIARVSYDARGGFLEVYDNNERPTGAFRSGFMSGGLF
jgi:hypothetical protein